MLEVIKYFKEETNIKFFAIKWGDGVNFYQELLKDNDCDRNVHWLDLQSRIRLRTLISTSDLVCDQFVIPAFGGVAIDSLGIGTPLITKVNRADELNFYGAISPVLNADDTGGILGHITALMQGKISFRDYFRSSTNFFDFYLHENLSGSKRIQIYRELMNLI
jgi:hypothetical protein